MKAIPEHAFKLSKTSERKLLPASDPLSDSIDSTVTLTSARIPTTDLPSVPPSDSSPPRVAPAIHNEPVKRKAVVPFTEILPLPKRSRPVLKHPRKKPPSYELIGNSTMQFVRDHVQKKNPRKVNLPRRPRPKSVRSKTIKAKVKPSQTKKDRVAKAKTGSRAKDTVPCGVCKVRCRDDVYQRSWIKCQKCLVWYHYDCQRLDDTDHIRRFTCVDCEDYG